MKRKVRYLGRSVLFVSFLLVAVGFVGMYVSSEAVAQIRPAYTKNVDEPGRQPYEAWVEFSQFSCSFNCSNFAHIGSTFIFNAPAVPAGKRLVIQWVSADIPSNNAFNSITLQSSPVLSNQNVKWQYHGPFISSWPAETSHGMSSAAFTTYGPEETPHIRLRINDPNNFIGNVTISGYLIDAN